MFSWLRDLVGWIYSALGSRTVSEDLTIWRVLTRSCTMDLDEGMAACSELDLGNISASGFLKDHTQESPGLRRRESEFHRIEADLPRHGTVFKIETIDHRARPIAMDFLSRRHMEYRLINCRRRCGFHAPHWLRIPSVSSRLCRRLDAPRDNSTKE